MPQVKMMLDSGAFSAWRLNDPISLDEYCGFLERNHDWIAQYVNMDDIRPHDTPTAARISFENLVEMRRRGFAPIPVFHVGEELEYLDRMLDLGCDYIGISTTSAKGEAIDQFLDLAWSKLVTPDGRPVVKVHSFGNSYIGTLLKYPWASADSSSWLRGQKYGKVLVPDDTTLGMVLNHRHALKNDLDDAFYNELDGGRVLHNRRTTQRDIEFLTADDQGRARTLIEGMGVDFDRLVNEDRKSVWAWMAHSYIAAVFYLDIEKQVNAARPIRFKPPGGLAFGYGSDKPAIEEAPEFDLYMAIGASPANLPSLTYAGVYKALASYYYTFSDSFSTRLRSYHNDPESVMRQKPYDRYTTMLEDVVGSAARAREAR